MRDTLHSDKSNNLATNGGTSKGVSPRSGGGAGVAESQGFATPFPFQNLTRSQRIVAERRQATLLRVEEFKRQGMSEAEAARRCGYQYRFAVALAETRFDSKDRPLRPQVGASSNRSAR